MIKTFPIRLSLEEHARIQVAARKEGKSMIQFVMEAIEEKINRQKEE